MSWPMPRSEYVTGEEIDRVYDNGYENGFLVGAQVERERIIALIEREWESEAMATNSGCEWLIELIKGEEQ